MSIILDLFTCISSHIAEAIISLILIVFLYKILKLYYLVSTLPPGPTPLPLLGNILVFRFKTHWNIEILKFAQKYGPVFTLWMGSTPCIIITDIDIAKETFRLNEFSGRLITEFAKRLSNDTFRGVGFTEFGNTWEALRKVTHTAIQKLAVNENLKFSASDCVVQTFKLIMETEDMNKPLDPLNYIFYTFFNVYAKNCFGKSYNIEDNLFKQCHHLLRYFGKEVTKRVYLWELSPIIRLIDRKLLNKQKQLIKDLIERAKIDLNDHNRDYESVVRDICDVLISARNNALKERKKTSHYLTNDNLALSALEQFTTGMDANHQTFLWILLLLAYYPNTQNKLRQEIESIIGDRIPTQVDRNRCHYVMAFISETLRFRNIAPLGVLHMTEKTSKIDKYTIQQGICVAVYQGSILTDEKYWSNGDQFRPERFLENGEYIKTRPKAYIPFSVGRHVCLGENLTYVDLFAVLVRWMQLTTDIVLHSHNGLEADPNVLDVVNPKPYKISFNMSKLSTNLTRFE